MATLAKKPVKGPWGNWRGDWETGIKAEEEALEKLMAVSDALPEGEIVGYVYTYPVADNYARYRVAKAKPLTLELIPFLDGYEVSQAHMRGLRASDIIADQKRTRAWKRLVSKKSA